MDAFMIAFALRRRIFYMGKSELFRGWRGTVFALLGGFPIRRGVWDMDAFDTAQALMDRGHSLAMFVEGGVSPEGGYRPAKSGLGYLAHRCGATVLPVHLDGSRKLYRPWTWPNVKITIGEPFTVEQVGEPSREQCQSTSEKALEIIKSMDPKLTGTLETYDARADNPDRLRTADRASSPGRRYSRMVKWPSSTWKSRTDEHPEEFAAAAWRAYFDEHPEEFAADLAEAGRLLGEGASDEELAAWVFESRYRRMVDDPPWQTARREAHQEVDDDGRL
jgi:hypothetical protein